MGKRFCPAENDYFPATEFTVVDGTLVHTADPTHRATDGLPVNIVDGQLEPTDTFAFGLEPAEEE